ncbi:hypothetical protein OnM2_091031 [Erysiphe neolycopersici]|uniref:Uncharacterized protein n=1 Tax=Erysiphe neolycopersici TaxID=212602 RepID=A0A420HCY4_9PEZI|nr:hypothetical protein OnM2_091031 [Erysiphe neolycopersici]
MLLFRRPRRLRRVLFSRFYHKHIYLDNKFSGLVFIKNRSVTLAWSVKIDFSMSKITLTLSPLLNEPLSFQKNQPSIY